MGNVHAKVTRLAKEMMTFAPDMKSLTCNLPLHPNASIFIRKDENRMDVFKVLMSGPIGTPYSGADDVIESLSTLSTIRRPL